MEFNRCSLCSTSLMFFVVEFKIENKMENLASGNAADIGCQYLMQGMSHTALEVY